jgi:uncharacterized protein (TIGR02302 family)
MQQDDASATSPTALLRRIGRLRLIARFSLFLESLLPAFWPLLAVCGVFLVLAFFAVPGLLPFWAHWVYLAVFAGLVLRALLLGLRRTRLPDPVAADRRIEQESGLKHQPLAVLEDRPGVATPEALALWQVHVARLAAGLQEMRAGAPRISLAPQDPLALRAVLLLALVTGAVTAGADRLPLLREALLPQDRTPAAPLLLDAWITPPAYTRAAPVFLGALPPGTAVEVPAGSVLSARISHLKRNPLLKIDGVESPFEGQGDDAWSLERQLLGGSSLTITDGRRDLAAWPLSVRPDAVPTVEFVKDPSVSPRGALRIDWKARDDYAVETVTADIRRPGREGIPPLSLKLASPRRAEAAGAFYTDLTDHPWAGLPVEIRLTASDGKGQAAGSAPFAMTLPERRFTHPIARAIILNRKILVQDPDAAEHVAEAVRDIQVQTGRYDNDTVVFLGLGTIYARLRLSEDVASIVEPVQRLLWDLAVRVEEGDIGTIERDLRAAEQAMRDAIQQNAPDPELEKAIADMQRAMDRYMEAMMRRAYENARREQPRPSDPNSRVISSRDLQQMLDKARDLARMGQKEAAQAMLDQLRELMEQLANSEPMLADGDQEGMESDNPAAQMMQNLQDLARRQRDLMDRSMQQANRQRGQQGQRGQQQGQQGQGQQGQQPGEGEGEGLAGDQEALRRQLGELMRQMGEMGNIPGGLGRAEQAMRQAQEALGGGQPGQAAGAQGQALDQMRQALRELGQQMQQQMGQGQGRGQGQPQRQNGTEQAGQERGRDPLGREPPRNGEGTGGGVTIPDDNQVERSRAIFDELRRRAGEPARPPVERDYIDRLLRWF